jgi:hypothetical protein
MTVNGKKIYAETCTLEHCLVNFQPNEMPPKMRERLHEVFPTTDVGQTYVTLAFNANTETNTETNMDKKVYSISGFWNPHISGYEFY